MAAANREAVAAKGSPPAAKRGRLSEREWVDVRHAARLAREEGVKLRVHGIAVTGLLKQQCKVQHKACKVVQKPAETAAPKPPPVAVDETSPPPLSNRKQRSAQRLLEYQQKKRAATFLARCPHLNQVAVDRMERNFQRCGHHRLLALGKLRWLLWRAWARWRPIFGGVALGYTSLREQYVYKRAAKLYNAAFLLDPGKSGRPLAAWLRHATPVAMETESVDSASGGQPPKRAKKSRGNRAQALSVTYGTGG